ncbi:hypothetical protein [Bacteroides clarus]|uniref:hypothetical protein n=1 Tax=Bacteroides clarus TaxID=626929 RepID=UPI0026664E2B|nr:hypothetical protein [Bacteroides clarus]
MEAITIPHVRIPSINIGGICLPGIGAPGSIGKKGLIWPSGMKEAIKAIYDPKKQGLTNYDVIEAYTEDFKKWNNSPEKYTGSLTSNSLALTNVSQKTALIYSPIKPYDFKVLIRGLQEGQHVKFGFDYGEHILEADKDGVYTLEWKEGLISYGIYTNFVGECNITITQLPTSILKDLSGNGNHAYLYGGKGKLNSGMGVYKQDYTTYKNDGNTNVEDVKPDTFVLLAGNLSRLGMPYKDIVGENIPAYKINVTGITDGTVTYFYRNEDGKQLQYVIKSDGEYELPTCYREGTEGTAVNIVANNNSNKITITQIPDYPDQLCYDGKMYAVCYGFPILTDYTVMADRTWFDKTGVKYFLSKYKENESVPAQLFKFEWIVNGKEYSTSLGRDKEVVFPNEITWQTKTSYNGKGLPNSTYEDGDLLLIGKVWLNSTNYFIGCHGAIIIADHSFTEEEINWLKQNWDKI